MIRSIISVGVFTVACALAQAAGASKKPVVCLAYVETTMPVDGKASRVAVCTDGKKPIVLTQYTVSTIKDEDGESVKVAIGWR